MKRKILFGFIVGIVLSIIGLLVGMNIGGNYYTEFEFLGQRGYEATGYLGAIIGAVIGFLTGIFIEVKLLVRKKGKF